VGDTDVIHRFGRDLDWNESFYFSFYDKENDICAFMRIGLKPNRLQKNVFCFLMMPDGKIIGIKRDAPFKDTEINAAGLVFQKIVPEKRWKLMFNGGLYSLFEEGRPLRRVSFMLDWEGLNEIFDYRECVSGIKEEISKRVASEHLEQFGRVKGILEVGGKRYEIDGLGERDHSWGVRDWTAPRMWIWLTCQFSDDCALNVTKLVVDQGEIDAGFIHLGGRNIPIVETRIDTVYGDAGAPESFEMVLTDKEGKEHHVTALVKRKAIMEFPNPEGHGIALMHETLAEYRMGDKVGYGIAEYLIRERPDVIQIIGTP
jgi:hypothetical protein